jgi:hypothetical protein
MVAASVYSVDSVVDPVDEPDPTVALLIAPVEDPVAKVAKTGTDPIDP